MARGVVVHAVAGVFGIDTFVILSAIHPSKEGNNAALIKRRATPTSRRNEFSYLAIVGVDQVSGALRQCGRRSVAVRQRFQDVHAALPVQHLRTLPAAGRVIGSAPVLNLSGGGDFASGTYLVHRP